jgi:hypothetical protein
VREAVRGKSTTSDSGDKIELHVSTHGISAPSDVGTLRDLLAIGHTLNTGAAGRKTSQVH